MIVVQEIKIDNLIGWLSSSLTTNSSSVFLRILSFNSPHMIELNQTSINEIQQNLVSKTSVNWYI